ncbi:transposase [Egbenema bharatensis]|uniref:transposase n=1 Tax=Egbenema bharatensis TaxID=3463334 RepID=UPI003A8B70F1
MPYNPNLHHRRSIRLKGYDYSSSGAYFITICTCDRLCWFGEIVDEEMQLNQLGQVVANAWQWLAIQHSYIELDEWIVMPNHFHGILVITDTPRRGGSRTAPTLDTAPQPLDTTPTLDTTPQPSNPPQPPDDPTQIKSLGRLIGAFKTVSTKQINQIRKTPGTPIWQRNYY